ncbi:uncharacterized protein LOC142795183 [Rhipicephalus microplus]|uniref:uncharacterized protein LOC142795183 n=1 Tax=Rhipicephalus microplus TaxID=6941 RepID=UPI003F6B8770
MYARDSVIKRLQTSAVTWFLVYIRTFRGSRISKRYPVVAGALSDQVGCPLTTLMPCPGQPSTSATGPPPEHHGHHCSLITRAAPGCRATDGVEVGSASSPPREQSDVTRTEESASPVRNSFQDWKLLQKALTLQSEMEDAKEEDAGAARSEAEDAKKSGPGEQLRESGHPNCCKSRQQ